MMKSKNKTKGQPQVGSDALLGLLPGSSAWVIADGKATEVYIQAAIFAHPDNEPLPIVSWPGERSWRGGWNYRLDGYGWIHGQHVFADCDAAVMSVKPNAEAVATASTGQRNH